MSQLQRASSRVPAPEQTWTYSELTVITEQQISRLLEISEEKKALDDLLLGKIYEDFAQGAFVLWKTITKGRLDDVDYNRIEKMLARRHLP